MITRDFSLKENEQTLLRKGKQLLLHVEKLNRLKSFIKLSRKAVDSHIQMTIDCVIDVVQERKFMVNLALKM